MKIEFILLCIIGLVFLIDFLLKGFKKSSSKEIIEKPSNIKKNNWLYWILKRKKNILMLFFLILLTKVLVHYFLFSEVNIILGELNVNAILAGEPKIYDAKESFSYHFVNIFNKEVLLFIPCTLIILFFAWFFNDKIKAR